MVAFSCTTGRGRLRHTFDGQIIRFGSATGEDNLLGLGPDQYCYLPAGGIDGILGLGAKGMVFTGGIAVNLREEWRHGVKDASIHRRGGMVVQINALLRHRGNSPKLGLMANVITLTPLSREIAGRWPKAGSVVPCGGVHWDKHFSAS